jgi:hypothetical protein
MCTNEGDTAKGPEFMKPYLVLLIALTTPSIALAERPPPQLKVQSVASIRNYPGVAADRKVARANAPQTVVAKIERVPLEQGSAQAPTSEHRVVRAERSEGRLVSTYRSVTSTLSAKQDPHGIGMAHQLVSDGRTLFRDNQPLPSERPGMRWQLSKASIERGYVEPATGKSTTKSTMYSFLKRAPGSTKGPTELDRVSRATIKHETKAGSP